MGDIKKISFLQYLDSKKQLLESIKRDPIIINEHIITKYCKIAIGDITEKKFIDFKPKTQIQIVWQYENILKEVDINEMQRHPLKLKVLEQDVLVEYDLSYKDEKLTKWLSSNTKEIK